MCKCQTQYKQDAKLDWGIRECLKWVKEHASRWHGVMESKE